MAAPLTRVERALVESSRDLQAEGVAHALVGGRAVSARAEPRTTRDVKLAQAVNARSAGPAQRFASARA
ncbi:MAG: hypothetical protein IPL61_37080 [Myxococcales bacterium]|nr:hypothetical protein [Myxococcales bacterium]